MTAYPDQPLDDVNAHLDAIFAIADASRGNVRELADRLQLVVHQDNAAAVMLYLATYAAALAKRLREQSALPSEPADFLADAAQLVAHTVPRPE